MDPIAMARAERADLAELLAGLDERQWEAPSLCEGWRVRDVAAHVVAYDDLGVLGTAQGLARGRLSLDRTNALGVRSAAGLTTGQLLDRLRTHLEPGGVTRGLGGRIGLTDALVHHQDVRRPLGLARTVPPERLEVTLRFAAWTPVLPGRRLARGLHLRSEDVDWSSGHGPLVHGTGEALLMALAGRPAALADLSGPGLDLLAGRLLRR